MGNLIRSNQLVVTPPMRIDGLAVNVATNQPINTNVQPATRPAQPCDGDWEDYDGDAPAHPSNLATNAGIIQPVSGNLVWEDYETGEPDRAELELSINRKSGNRFQNLNRLDIYELQLLDQSLSPAVNQAAVAAGEWEDLD
jgi:hypothetical protein